jgi:CheY-like chemotaxis protein
MTVLLIDDDGYVSNQYEEALTRRLIHVKLCSTAEQALAIATNGHDRWDVIVLDVMLPWAPYTEAETAGGLHTGALLYRDLRVRYTDPVFIVLTAYARSQVPPELGSANITICKKADYPPRRFAKLVLELAGA